VNKKVTFSYKSKVSLGLIVIIALAFVLFVSLTIAFFYNDDYATSKIGMSGKVKIEAVGEGEAYNSIEDTHTSNLVITLGNGYDVLIPGMEVDINANCKVYKSTTKPLLRAKLEFLVTDNVTGSESDGTGFEGGQIGSTDLVVAEISGQLISEIRRNKWYLHTDGYYYYLGDVDQGSAEYGDQKMQEVAVTSGDFVVIDFLSEPFTFPTQIDSSYSGFGVQFKITFQAIQNYIPDENGNKKSNTITNSITIFDQLHLSYSDTTSLDYFTITQNASSQYEINPRTDKTLPDVIVLPSKDASNNTITAIGSGFSGNTNIKSIVVPSSYTTIANSAFANTTLITANLVNSNITTIPTSCFEGSTLESVQLPANLTVLGEKCFKDTELNSIVMPESLTTISSMALVGTDIVSLYIPASVTSIADYSIKSGFLYNIVVSDGNATYKDVNDKMLLTKNGTKFILGASIIDDEAFVIPDNVTTISQHSLSYCNAKIIFVPSSVTTIQVGAFNNCTLLKHIEFTSTTPPSVSGDIFSSCSADFKIYVPNSSVDSYKSATNLSSYSSRIFPVSDKPLKY